MPQRSHRHQIKQEKRPQQISDKKKLAVTSYLISIHPKGATRYNIRTNAKIRSQNDEEFEPFLEELVQMEWVLLKEPENVNGNNLYFITEEGRKAVNHAKDLARNSPLSKLDVFDGVLDF